MQTYYGLTNQLVWLKVDNSVHTAQDFIIIVDEENFIKMATQTIEVLNGINANK